MNESVLNPKRRPAPDWWMLAAAAALMVIGALFIYSATLPMDGRATGAWYSQFWGKQVVWYGIGTVALCAAMLLDYRALARLALPAYWGCIALLVLVLIPGIGSEQSSNARSWFRLGPLSVQPAEFAKLAMIFLMARVLSRPREALNSPMLLAKVIGMALLPFGLILKQPDLGSALTLVPVAFAMVFVAGVPARYLVRLSLGAGLVVSLVLVDVLFARPEWQVVRLGEYQKHRLQVYFGLEFAPPGATGEERAAARRKQNERTYNIRQALISVGSGGLTGKGWCRGTQTALGYLPRGVAHNDFIFSVIAEEGGLVASATVLVLYSVVLFSGLRVAGQASDRLGKLLAVGIVALLFSHVFENIGMNIRLMPVTGIPLPLLSYGGSSVLCSLFAIGVLQNVHLHRNQH